MCFHSWKKSGFESETHISGYHDSWNLVSAFLPTPGISGAPSEIRQQRERDGFVPLGANYCLLVHAPSCLSALYKRCAWFMKGFEFPRPQHVLLKGKEKLPSHPGKRVHVLYLLKFQEESEEETLPF